MKNIKKRDLDDKLKLLALGGFKTESGWDTAIPQHMHDVLISMGIEAPVRWFVADCTGPAASPVLVHIGEAYVNILEARSKGNQELFDVLFHTANGKNATHQDKTLFHFICDSPDNQINNESDAGFLDLNHIVAAFNTGWIEGCRATHKSLLAEAKPLVNENIVLASMVREAMGGDSPLRVVLHKEKSREYITHIQNMETMGMAYGHYFGPDEKHNAITDYLNRCAQYGVEPF